MTPTGIEPVLPPWKGDVLTAWPWSRLSFFLSVTPALPFLTELNSPSRARTYNNSVNSRVLYHWAIEDYSILLLPSFKTEGFYGNFWRSFLPIPSKPNTEFQSFRLSSAPSVLWLSPRPISKCQLNTLLCLHLIPIYLVVFKGSYSFLRDISSWGGLHA